MQDMLALAVLVDFAVIVALAVLVDFAGSLLTLLVALPGDWPQVRRAGRQHAPGCLRQGAPALAPGYC